MRDLRFPVAPGTSAHAAAADGSANAVMAATEPLVGGLGVPAGRRAGGVVVLIVEAPGRSGHILEARLGDDGIRVERTADVLHAAPLASAAGATVIVYMTPAGAEALDALAVLHDDPSTAGLPIVVMDESGGSTGNGEAGNGSTGNDEAARAAYAAGADEHWAGLPDLRAARTRLTALSRGVIAERERDEALRELSQARARLSEATARLAREQEIDEVTGLPNRRRLLAQLDVEWRRARRKGGPLSLILIEIERPGAGQRGAVDEPRFVRVAVALRTVLRRGGDLLARFGDNQLAASLPEVGPDGAAAVAQALRTAALCSEPTLFITMGIVTARPQESVAEGPATLINEAEANLRLMARDA